MEKEIPKYRQVEEYIIKEINEHRLKEGDQILTEEQLCEKFNFSRMTINKALGHLVENGYIKRIAGKGSFVAPPHVTKTLEEGGSFTDDMKLIGMRPGSRLISYQVLRGSDVPDVAQRLEVSSDDLIHYFIRLRTGNDEPIAISYNYISSLVLPAIDVKALDGSLNQYVASLGIQSLGNEVEMSAVLPTKEQMELLQVKDVALLRSEALSHVLKDGKEMIMGLVATYYIGTRYSYKFGRNHIIKNKPTPQ